MKLVKVSVAILVLLAIFVSLVSSVVYAQTPTPTPVPTTDPASISIESVRVFQNIFESGDWLFFVEYKVIYSPIPSAFPWDTFLVALSDGTAQRATRPLSYYNHNVTSIYLTPNQIASIQVANPSFTWGSALTLRLMGNPAIFTLVEDTNQDTHTLGPGEWVSGTATTSRDLLGRWMIGVARLLAQSWGLTLISNEGRLNSTGAVYFKIAVPGVDAVTPNYFETSISSSSGPSFESSGLVYPTEDVSTSLLQSGSGGNWEDVRDDANSVDSSSYVYTASTTESRDYYGLGSITLPPTASITSVVAHGTFRSTDGALVYARPYLRSGSVVSSGSLVSTGSKSFTQFSQTMPRPGGGSWSTSDLTSLELGVGLYTSGLPAVAGSPLSTLFTLGRGGDSTSFLLSRSAISSTSFLLSITDRVELTSLFLEVAYTMPGSSTEYQEKLTANMGSRLENSLNGLGTMLGVPSFAVALFGVGIFYFMLVGTIFTATGRSDAAIIFAYPFALAGAFVGTIMLPLVFAITLLVVIAGGIAIFLGRFA